MFRLMAREVRNGTQGVRVRETPSLIAYVSKMHDARGVFWRMVQVNFQALI